MAYKQVMVILWKIICQAKSSSRKYQELVQLLFHRHLVEFINWVQANTNYRKMAKNNKYQIEETWAREDLEKVSKVVASKITNKTSKNNYLSSKTNKIWWLRNKMEANALHLIKLLTKILCNTMKFTREIWYFKIKMPCIPINNKWLKVIIMEVKLFNSNKISYKQMFLKAKWM